jgi:hypothetical protein
MDVSNTVTVDRLVGVDPETGDATPPHYRLRFHYFDGDSQRDAIADLNATIGASVFDAVAKLANSDLAGRGEALSALVAEALALGTPTSVPPTQEVK